MCPGCLHLEGFCYLGGDPGGARSHWRDFTSHLAWERLQIPEEQPGCIAEERDVWNTQVTTTRPDPTRFSRRRWGIHFIQGTNRQNKHGSSLFHCMLPVKFLDCILHSGDLITPTASIQHLNTPVVAPPAVGASRTTHTHTHTHTHTRGVNNTRPLSRLVTTAKIISTNLPCQ